MKDLLVVCASIAAGVVAVLLLVVIGTVVVAVWGAKDDRDIGRGGF